MPVPPVIQMYRYVMGSGGLGNLLKASEEFQQTVDWVRYPTNSETPTVNADSRPDPNGGTTADQVDYTANTGARLMQTVTLKASTEYTFSVHARAVSGTVDFRMRNVTLKTAVQKTATTTGPLTNGFTRFTYTFTTDAAGSYELALQNASGTPTARSVIFWGAMLNQGGTAADYEYAAPTTGGSAPAPAYAGFGDAFGGVTAYYSLRQFTEAETLNAIRVRRSSDDTEQDIGFDANGDLDTTALTTFVNEDYNAYTSDFSSGIDGFVQAQVTASSVDGISDGTTSKDDVLQAVLTSGSNIHHVYQSGIFDLSNTYDVSFEYYIPSVRPDGVTPQTINALYARTGAQADGTYLFSVVDSWQSETIQNWSPTTNKALLFMCAVGTSTGGIDADGDVYYLKNIVVTQTTADGAVTTFYDQSGNGNDATNATASEQPLVVSGGTLVTENGKAAIEFEGVNDYLQNTSLVSSTPTTHYLTAKANRTGVLQRFFDGGVSSSTRHSIFQNASQFQYFAGGTITGTSEDTNQNLHYFLANGTSSEIGINGATASTGDAGTDTLNGLTFAARWDGGANFGDVLIQELIIFNSDQSGNRGTVTTGGGTLIEGNINTYFNIV